MVNNRLFEAPVELIGERVEILYHESNPEEIEVKWKQKTYGILPQLDLHINCRVKRDKDSQIELTGKGSSPSSGQLWEGK